jgi:hypothetical protein
MKRKMSSIWLYAYFVLIIFVLLGATTVIVGEDLILNGTTLVMHGEVEYDSVMIMNGGVLYVTPFDGTGDTGMLTIKANSIFVDATSSINADGAGYRAIENGNGEGPGGGEGGPTVWDGGGGGAYGGKGGDGIRDLGLGGTDGYGGNPYGNANSMCILMGSAGGSAGSRDNDYGGFGGNGGGTISLWANTIEISGTITTNGNDGLIYINDSSGGGAGGGILLVGGSVNIYDGLLRVEGGNGGTACGTAPCILDDGGGGGSGGRIKIFYRTLLDVSSNSISLAGGNGSYLGHDGEPGSYYTEKIIVEATIDIEPDTLNLKSNGMFITAYIELHDDYDLINILVSTILLNNSVPAKLHPVDIGDHDSDNIPDLMVKFYRSAVQEIIEPGEEVEITVSGELSDGTLFVGSDKIRVIAKGK